MLEYDYNCFGLISETTIRLNDRPLLPFTITDGVLLFFCHLLNDLHSVFLCKLHTACVGTFLQ